MKEQKYVKIRKTPAILLVFCFLVSLTSFVVSAEAKGGNANETISSELASKMSEVQSNGKIQVLVVLKDQVSDFYTPSGKKKIFDSQKEIKLILEKEQAKGNVIKIRPIRVVNCIAAEVTPNVIATLSARSEIKTIEPDKLMSLPEGAELDSHELASTSKKGTSTSTAWGVDKIGVPSVRKKWDLTGKGITVAVVDTGIDATHPDLAKLPGKKNKKVIGWTDFVNGKPSPYDDHGHGTHVSGTISGTGVNGYQTGVAPGTTLIVAKVFNKDGWGYMSDVILAFEWAVDNKAKIINFSGAGSHEDIMTMVINNVVKAGVTPVIAAGNSGPGDSTILCPGDETNSLTVGATDYLEVIASFSSRGPVKFKSKNFIKPEVCAPGVYVLSTFSGGQYRVMSGTSMATPHVSGTVALMLQKNPSLTPSKIKQILENTAVGLGPTGMDNIYGAGRINAYKAIFSK